MDLDGDGFISMYELEYFYEEQLQRMESLGIETLPFEDCLCQVYELHSFVSFRFVASLHRRIGSPVVTEVNLVVFCLLGLLSLQMLDMIRPTVAGKISLADMKRCQMAPIFFDTFFNLEKYLDHEQRDPFASQRDPDSETGDDAPKVIAIENLNLLKCCHFQ